TALWTESHSSVVVTDGLFDVKLGSITPFASDLFAGDSRFLGVTIEGESEMTPRLQFTSAPFSLQAGRSYDVVDGSITADKLVNGAVTADKLADGAVTNTKIAPNAVGTGKIGDGEIQSADLADGAVSANKLDPMGAATGQVLKWDGMAWVPSEDSVGAGGTGDITAVTAEMGLVGGGTDGDVAIGIGDGGVTAAKLATGSVTSAKLAANSVTAGAIAANAVGSSEIATGGVTAADIATGAVGSSQIATNGVTASDIAAGAVGSSELQEGVVFGSTTAGGAVSVNAGEQSSRQIVSNGTSGSRRVPLHYLYDWDNNLQAGMFVSPDGSGNGTGTVFADTKNFIVPDPEDPSRLIRYTSLEGPEAAMYVRGQGNLVAGTGRVEFPDHFRVLAEPATITVSVTPRSAGSLGLAAVDVSGAGFTVVELNGGSGSYPFDYVAYSVRSGYLNYEVYLERAPNINAEISTSMPVPVEVVEIEAAE
ncbi:MAG: hypothetical protein KJO98_11800, partial [Rhodothermia bacterium]|nr:hypothetical protein [Rhodothermia bacterium]